MNHSALRFLRNVLSWLASNVLSRIVAAALFIFLTRQVELAETGTYALATTFTALFMPLTGWGLEHIFIRDVSSKLALSGTYLPRFLIYRFFFTIFSYLLLLIVVRQIGYAPSVENIILLSGAILITDGLSELLQSVLVTFEKTHMMLYVTVPVNLLRLGSGILMLFLGWGVWGVILVLIGSSLVKLLALGYIVIKYIVGIRLELDDFHHAPQRLWNLLIEVYPFVLIDLFWTIEYQSGSVILSIMMGEEAVGLYGTAFTLLAVTMLIGQAYMMAIFPVLARLYQQDREAFDRIYELSCLYLLMIGLPIAIVVTCLHQQILSAIFPPSYQQSGYMLVPLIWTVPLFLLHTVVSRVMLLENRQGKLALFSMLGAAVNIVGTPLLIVLMGTVGTGWARLLSYTLFFIANYAYVRRNVHPLNLWQLSAMPCLFAAISILIFTLLGTFVPTLPPIFSMTIALLSYGICLWATGIFKLADLHYFGLLLEKSLKPV